LDSFAAKQVLTLLQSVARAGNTVLFTIHQPASDVFRAFDRLIVLHRGRMMYTGMTKTVPIDFERLGYSVPENYNPADWILDVAQGESTEMLESHGFFPQEQSLAATEYRDYDLASMKPEVHKESCCAEFGLLLEREKNSLVRSPLALIANVIAVAFISLVFGAIFFGIGKANRANISVSKCLAVIVYAMLTSLIYLSINEYLRCLVGCRERLSTPVW
jgi:hypothetical protein